jgi:hypothetical protein
VNVFECGIGAFTEIGTFVEIQKGRSSVTAARSSRTFVCEGVTLEDDVFVGHGVVCINDPRPRATIHGQSQAEIDSVSIRAACRGEDRLLRFGSHQSRSVSEGLQQVSCTEVAHLQRRPVTSRT